MSLHQHECTDITDNLGFASHLAYLPTVQKTVQISGLRSIRQRRIVPGFIVVGPQQTRGRACADKNTLTYCIGTTAHLSASQILLTV